MRAGGIKTYALGNSVLLRWVATGSTSPPKVTVVSPSGVTERLSMQRQSDRLWTAVVVPHEPGRWAWSVTTETPVTRAEREFEVSPAVVPSGA
jgi:hypothetical protein